MPESLTRSGLPRVLLAAMLLLAVPWAAADIPVPQLKARVTDLTGTLTREQQAALEQELARFEARKGAQVAILMVPTTQPETVEQYSVRVEESWKLGRKGVDDGVLIVVAKNDRRLRIEVGYGLEGALPDAVAKRIIDEDITPRFKQGDFYGGLRAGADRVVRVIEGERLPEPPGRQAGTPLFERLNWIIPAFIVLLVAERLINALFGRFLGSGLTGGVAGFLAWFVVGSLVIGAIVGVIAFFFALASGSALRRGARGGGTGYSGSWSSGGSYGGGGSGGGFSGGGGGSGGGGASGSW